LQGEAEMQVASSILSMGVAATLLVTGLVHAAQPYYFIHTLSSYRLLPPSLNGLLGLYLPYLQVVLALCIGLRVAEKVALYAAAGLFGIFSLAQVAVLSRGIEIDCGCFGFVAHKVSPASAALPILLSVACAVAVACGDRFPPAGHTREGAATR
jgi:hypothetical protein